MQKEMVYIGISVIIVVSFLLGLLLMAFVIPTGQIEKPVMADDPGSTALRKEFRIKRVWNKDGSDPPPRITVEEITAEAMAELGNISGFVSNEDDDPVEDAFIDLIPNAELTPLIGKIRAAEGLSRSFENGAYVVLGVKPGQYLMRVVKEGYIPFEEPLYINPREVIGHKDILLVRADFIHGFVTSKKGGPVSGAQVTVHGPGFGLNGAVVEVDEDGSYELAGLVVGAKYDLDVYAWGCLPEETKKSIVAGKEEVNFNLARGGYLQGTASSRKYMYGFYILYDTERFEKGDKSIKKLFFQADPRHSRMGRFSILLMPGTYYVATETDENEMGRIEEITIHPGSKTTVTLKCGKRKRKKR